MSDPLPQSFETSNININVSKSLFSGDLEAELDFLVTTSSDRPATDIYDFIDNDGTPVPVPEPVPLIAVSAAAALIGYKVLSRRTHQ